MKKISLLLLLLLILPGRLYSQNATNISYIYANIHSNAVAKSQNGQLVKSRQNIVIDAILFYQKYLSIRDMKICNFQTSCSEFSKQAILQYGVFWGMLMTNDRLLRDNSFAYRYYQHSPKASLLSDTPLESHYLPNYLAD